MAASSTLSPDSIHGGPAIATLSGILATKNKDAIDRGDIFSVEKGSPNKFHFEGNKKGNLAIAAEAVTLNHNQLKHGGLVHIPVVVFGRTQVNLTGAGTTTYHGGDMAYIDPTNANFELTNTQPSGKTSYRVTFLHPKEDMKTKPYPYEVFVEPYRA
jgi:hypothetical protein